MKLMKKIIVLLVLLMIPSLSFSMYVSKGSLYRFMEVSGLDQQIADLPAALQQGLDQARQQQTGNIQAELYDAVTSSVMEAFDPERFRVYVGNEIRFGITEGDAVDLIAWYESPIGREIAAAEIKAGKTEALQEATLNSEALMADVELMAKARSIVDLTGMVDFVHELQMKTALATFSAMIMALSPENKSAITAFRQQLKSQEPQMRQQIESFVVLSVANTYKDVSPAMLDKYMQFLESPQAQKVNASIMQGMQVAFIKSINNMAKSLRANLRKLDLV